MELKHKWKMRAELDRKRNDEEDPKTPVIVGSGGLRRSSRINSSKGKAAVTKSAGERARGRDHTAECPWDQVQGKEQMIQRDLAAELEWDVDVSVVGGMPRRGDCVRGARGREGRDGVL
ncbi:hypothetical protein CYMTET_41999 [Cymbomonas tetramitiformis]|uniref:Uncharacterized protein n=1 Tax=Cymbomonas tetramitiformis TaxID=36881 RepID=A0AAE0C6A3_9CHLO|nr:hypothetical protein CYMTET_41999 [Cymbomonas tetramitiformis]